MNYVNEQNMQEILDGIARKIGQGGTGSGLEDWQASHEYAENDICVYNGQIYKAIVGFESDTTFSTTQILEEYTLQSGDVPIAYTQGTDISIDDIVSYDGNYYKALYDFTCGDTFGLYALEQYTPKELTKSQEDSIVQDWIDNLGGGGSSGGSSESYSTTEKRIGTWIDGKPLYKKTAQFTTPNATGTQQYSFLPDIPFAIIDTLVNVDGFVVRTDGWQVPQNYCDGDFYCGINKSLSMIVFKLTDYSGAETTNKPAVLTFKYTKTTD